MYNQRGIYTASILALALLTGLLSFVITAQKKSKDTEQQPTGTPVLWRDPGDVSSRNLLTGPGSEGVKPDLSKITYIRDEQTGYSVKYHVKDGAGKTWVVKVGNEARPETAAVRLIWAVGYVSEINYLVPCLHIPGAAKPRKDVPRCEGDGFADARFEARPDDVKRLDIWSWKNNPFAGTKEFKGLVVLMALLNNWDLKDENNKVISVKGTDGQNELQYIISDLGATFGKTGGAITHSRNEPENYAKSKFINGVEGGRVRFAYSGKSQFLFDNIMVEDARWIANLLARLTDQQIGDAFRAADFKPDEVQVLASTVRARINELVRVTGATTAAPAAPAQSPMPEATPQPTPQTTPTPGATPTSTPTQEPPPTDTLPSPTPEATPSPTATPMPMASPSSQ
ncbi:MAG TPA: hypothetical protein VGC66_02555 [Pyrinomonadaceae bacterium]|jgi:hypothetical protein